MSTNTNTDEICCDLCDKKLDVNKIIQNGYYLHCKSCYIWLTIKYDSKTNGVMCSNCKINPVAKKHLCGFTDWCSFCDTTLWSTKDDDKIYETE